MPRGLLFIFQYRRNRKVDHSCFEDNAALQTFSLSDIRILGLCEARSLLRFPSKGVPNLNADSCSWDPEGIPWHMFDIRETIISIQCVTETQCDKALKGVRPDTLWYQNNFDHHGVSDKFWLPHWKCLFFRANEYRKNTYVSDGSFNTIQLRGIGDPPLQSFPGLNRSWKIRVCTKSCSISYLCSLEWCSRMNVSSYKAP